MCSELGRCRDDELWAILATGLAGLTTETCCDRLIARWAQDRRPVLGNVIRRRRWVASWPVDRRVLSALFTGEVEPLLAGDGAGPKGTTFAAAMVEPLIVALADRDPAIAAAARAVVPRLRHRDSIDALCRWVVEHDDDADLRAVVVAAGFEPAEAHDRALFLFLTGRLDAYEALDFDQRLLHTVYRTADGPLRKRILQQLRTAGRVDLLPRVLGDDSDARAAVMTTTEADFLLEMYGRGRHWHELWRLVFELPPIYSARALVRLHEHGWQPDGAGHRELMRQLLPCATATAEMSEQKMRAALPPLLRAERVRVSGHIRDVAFSPTRPVLAIAAGRSQVVLWELPSASTVASYDFSRAVGRLAYTDAGTLVCGERAATRAPCGIYRVAATGPARLCQVGGSVSVLQPVAGDRVLFAARDGALGLLHDGRVQSGQQLGRAKRVAGARVDAAGHRALLLRNRPPALVNLPGFATMAMVRPRPFDHRDEQPVAGAAEFLPDGSFLFGHYSGKLLAYERHRDKLVAGKAVFAPHDDGIRGIRCLPEHQVVVTASSDGAVRVTDWVNRTRLGEVRVVDRRLTSLAVSPAAASWLPATLARCCRSGTCARWRSRRCWAGR